MATTVPTDSTEAAGKQSNPRSPHKLEVSLIENCTDGMDSEASPSLGHTRIDFEMRDNGGTLMPPGDDV